MGQYGGERGAELSRTTREEERVCSSVGEVRLGGERGAEGRRAGFNIEGDREVMGDLSLDLASKEPICDEHGMPCSFHTCDARSKTGREAGPKGPDTGKPSLRPMKTWISLEILKDSSKTLPGFAPPNGPETGGH
jgi:hypothetical protein